VTRGKGLALALLLAAASAAATLYFEPGRPSGIGLMNQHGNRVAAEAIAAALPARTLKSRAEPL